MNYEQAKQIKTQTGNTKEIDGEIWNVSVTPSNQNDFDRYLEHAYAEWPDAVPDEHAKLFCSNNTYKVKVLLLMDSIFTHNDL